MSKKEEDGEGFESASAMDEEYSSLCVPIHLKHHPSFASRPKVNEKSERQDYNYRRTCSICKKRAVYYCRACSFAGKTCLVVCGPVKGLVSECWSKHAMGEKGV